MTLDLRLVANGGQVTTETDSAAASDTTGVITATASTVSFAALTRDVGYWRSIDYGAAYFTTNFSLTGKVNISAISAAAGRFSVGFSSADVNFRNTDTENAVIFSYYGATTTTLYSQVLHKVNTTITNSTDTWGGAISTDWYYAFVKSSAFGGQYGGIALITYIEEEKTTKVAGVYLALTANNSGQYLLPVSSYSNATTPNITGTHGDITLGSFSAGQDLTTGVETDTGTGRLVVWPDVIVATALNIANGEAAKHVAIDEGAGFFGDYTVSGVLNVTTATHSGLKFFDIIAVTDGAADALLANDLQGISIEIISGTVFTPYIHQAASGTDTFSTAGPACNWNQPYSITLSRTGSTLTMKVWNDLVLTNFVGTSQVGSTVTWTSQATTTYRYLMPVASHLNGATSKSATFTLGGVKVLGSTTTGTISETTQDTTGNITGEVSSTTGTISETTQDTTGNVTGVIPTVGTLSETTEDTLGTLSGDTGSTIGTLSETTGDTTGNVVGTLTVLATLSETTEATTGNIEATTPNMGTFSETTADTTGTILGEFSQSPTELFSVTVRNATTGAKLTGLTNVLISVVDDATGYRFDHTDQNFRAVSAIPTLPMTEFSAANNPGYYTSTLTVLTWDSEYTITIEYDDGTRINTWVQSGVEYVNGVRVKVSSRAKPSDIPSAAAIVAVSDAVVVDGSINRAKYERIILAGIGGKRSGIGSAAEQYFGQDGTTVRIAFTPDSSGNGTPVLDGA